MPDSQNPLHHITELIDTKCSVKQQTYRNLQDVFSSMKTGAADLIHQIKEHAKTTDRDITIEISTEGENEFHLKVAGDLLVFLLHSNIVILPQTHGYNTTEHVAENPLRKYLGQINVYNFMADSLKYNRINDPGYLVSRFFVNCDNYFLVEGDGQLNFLFEPVSAKPVEEVDISIFLQLVLSQAMDNDLVTPPFPSIRQISLFEKMERSANVGMGSKIGFQMSYNQDEDLT